MAFGKEKTLEQQQLEEARANIIRQLDEFYAECTKKVERSAQDIREYAAELDEREKELEEAKQEKRAKDILNGIGRQLARLYNTILDMPDDNVCKSQLVECIKGLNSEFANYGVGVIYHHGQKLERGSKNCDVTHLSRVGDKSLDGIVSCNKIGFRIENQSVINEEVTECTYDSAFAKEQQKIEDAIPPQKSPETTLSKPVETTQSKSDGEASQYPFAKETDFIVQKVETRDGQAYWGIVLKTAKMEYEFSEMQTWGLGDNQLRFVPFDTLLDCKSPKKSKYKKQQFDKYVLRIDGNILFLLLYRKNFKDLDLFMRVQLAIVR